METLRYSKDSSHRSGMHGWLVGLITVYASAGSRLWYVINRMLSWWPDGVRCKAQGAFVEITGLIYPLFLPVQLHKKIKNKKKKKKKKIKQEGKKGKQKERKLCTPGPPNDKNNALPHESF